MPLAIDEIRRLRPQNDFHYYPTLGSTMTEAARLIAGGARSGTIVVADEQTAGVGRLGRSWISERDVGVYASAILALVLPPAYLPVASLLIGLAVAEAIEKATQLACDLRWPNDVLIDERKVAGILPQLVDDWVVAGVGINVNNTAFATDLRTPATSLLLAGGGRPHSREKVLLCLLESLDSFADLLAKSGPQAILRAFTAKSSYVTNRRVIVEENGMRGVTSGLDPSGFLLVRSDEGVLRRVASGGVRPDGGASA